MNRQLPQYDGLRQPQQLVETINNELRRPSNRATSLLKLSALLTLPLLGLACASKTQDGMTPLSSETILSASDLEEDEDAADQLDADDLPDNCFQQETLAAESEILDCSQIVNRAYILHAGTNIRSFSKLPKSASTTEGPADNLVRTVGSESVSLVVYPAVTKFRDNSVLLVFTDEAAGIRTTDGTLRADTQELRYVALTELSETTRPDGGPQIEYARLNPDGEEFSSTSTAVTDNSVLVQAESVGNRIAFSRTVPRERLDGALKELTGFTGELEH
jgi:hypothetical protein